MEKQNRIKELVEQEYSEEATVNQIKAEFPYSTKSYAAEQKIRELYQEVNYGQRERSSYGKVNYNSTIKILNGGKNETI